MNDVSQTGTIMGALSAALTTLLGFIGFRLHGRVDTLATEIDKVKQEHADLRVIVVSREELRQYMEAMRTDRTAMHQENQTHLQRIYEQVVQSNSIGDALSRAEFDIRDLRAWKHERADPYIGAVDALNARVANLERDKSS